MSLATITTKKGLKVNGKYIIPCTFDDIIPAVIDGKESDEIFLTIDDGFLGAAKVDINKENYTAIKNEFYSITDFSDGIAVISIYCERFGEKCAIINKNLDILTDFEYDSIETLSNKLFKVKKYGRYGVINSNGKEIISCEFEAIEFNDGKIEVVPVKGVWI